MAVRGGRAMRMQSNSKVVWKFNLVKKSERRIAIVSKHAWPGLFARSLVRSTVAKRSSNNVSKRIQCIFQKRTKDKCHF